MLTTRMWMKCAQRSPNVSRIDRERAHSSLKFKYPRESRSCCYQVATDAMNNMTHTSRSLGKPQRGSQPHLAWKSNIWYTYILTKQWWHSKQEIKTPAIIFEFAGGKRGVSVPYTRRYHSKYFQYFWGFLKKIYLPIHNFACLSVAFISKLTSMV